MSLPVNSYARRILLLFAEAYPGSSHLRGGRKVRKGSWEKVFPEITRDVTAKEEFLRGVEALVSRQIVSAKWKRFREGDEVEALYLEDPAELYRETDLRDPEQTRLDMLECARSRRPKTEASRAVREAVTARLEAYHDPFVSDPDDLRDIFALFDLSPSDIRGRTIRALSVLLFRDSKRIETLLPVADKLSRSVLGEGVSELLGLSRKYPEALFCLHGRLVFTHPESPAWDTRGTALSLPEASLDSIREVCLNDPAKRVLTVENKETYYTACSVLPDRFGCFVYTGGYPNTAVKKFLKLLTAAGGALWHFGDLDPEGIAILLEVEKRAEKKIEPFCMDPEIYRTYAEYGYKLGSAAIAKLESITDRRFAGLLTAMKHTGKGVEQEIIDLSAVSRKRHGNP